MRCPINIYIECTSDWVISVITALQKHTNKQARKMRFLFLIAFLPFVICRRGRYDRPTKVCKDSSDHCNKRMHCPRYQDACKETCGLCRGPKKNNIPYPQAPGPIENCKDSSDHCNKRMHCPRYQDACKKTCGLCNGGYGGYGGYGVGAKRPRGYGVLGAAADQPEEQAPQEDECEDVLPDDCPEIAENNWCHEPSYEGKCCKSCKLYKENKTECFDEEKGCSYHNKDNFMCENYGEKCKKTCKKCWVTMLRDSQLLDNWMITIWFKVLKWRCCKFVTYNKFTFAHNFFLLRSPNIVKSVGKGYCLIFVHVEVLEP